MKATTVKDILEFVQQIFKVETCWTKRAYARNGNGERLGSHQGGACCWCLQGVLWHASDVIPGGPQLAQDARALLEDFLPSRFGNIEAFNDDPKTTIADIRTLLESAIATL